MSAKTVTTGLLKNLSGRLAKAHEQHKGDETNHGFVDLPPGIRGALATLVTAELGQFKTGDDVGQPFVLFAAIIQEPEYFEGQKLRGRRAQNTYPLCDQPKRTQKAKESTGGVKGQWGHDKGSFEENWADFENELRKMGIDTENAPLGSEEGLRLVLSGLQQSRPLVRISTREWENPATKKKMVFTSFDGALHPDEARKMELAGASGFTETAPSANGTADHTQGTADETTEENFDLIAVAAEAEAGDEAAWERMKEEARKYGITDEEIEQSSNWDNINNDGTSLREMIEAKMGGTDGGTEPEPEPEPAWEPKVGATCKYQIKAGGKFHDVKVEKVNKKEKTADLLNLTDKKTKYLAQPFSKLSKS